jgi:hypothetical protein
LWPGKESKKTPRGVISPGCVKYRRTPKKKAFDDFQVINVHVVSAGKKPFDKNPISGGRMHTRIVGLGKESVKKYTGKQKSVLNIAERLVK